MTIFSQPNATHNSDPNQHTIHRFDLIFLSCFVFRRLLALTFPSFVRIVSTAFVDFPLNFHSFFCLDKQLFTFDALNCFVRWFAWNWRWRQWRHRHIRSNRCALCRWLKLFQFIYINIYRCKAPLNATENALQLNLFRRRSALIRRTSAHWVTSTRQKKAIEVNIIQMNYDRLVVLAAPEVHH